MFFEIDEKALAEHDRRMAELFQQVSDAALSWSNSIAEQVRPVILHMEDVGLLESTYETDLLEPEWDVFI